VVRSFYLRVLNLSKWAVIKMIIGYQYFIGPCLPPSCRFEPSCSEYTKLVIIKYGIIKGVWLGFLRLLRCQPFLNCSQSKCFKD